MSSAEPRFVGPRDMIRSGLCVGCGGCVAASGPPGRAMRWNPYGLIEPDGPASWLRARTPEFSRTCPFSPAAADESELADAAFPNARHRDERIGRFEAAYVGHVAEPGFRESGSSGGMTSWVAAELLRTGLVDAVAHVVACDPREEGRLFRYRISRTRSEVRAGARSRYYPVELSDTIRAIRSAPGRYAVVGIPCFVKAINLLRRENPVLRERIAFTLGLYCGHMKSARMVESFAWQMGVFPEAVAAIDFRLKDPRRPANWYRAQLRLRGGGKAERDWWHLVDGDWGAGFFQNGACDYCDDVVAETADISFGDAWVEPYSSDGRGTNVVIVRSAVLHPLLQAAIADGRLALSPVDADFVERTQAAGFRQRREGLAWRLARRRRGLAPRKRVAPAAGGLPVRRRLVYLARQLISAWSHRMFRLARTTGRPGVYTGWARAVLAAYHALAYSRGPLGRWLDRVAPPAGGNRGQCSAGKSCAATSSHTPR
jgi:coenzyme F420-reducing hydrogenase beta subunit